MLKSPSRTAVADSDELEENRVSENPPGASRRGFETHWSPLKSCREAAERSQSATEGTSFARVARAYQREHAKRKGLVLAKSDAPIVLERVAEECTKRTVKEGAEVAWRRAAKGGEGGRDESCAG